MPESEGPERPACAGAAPPPGAGAGAPPAALTSFVGRERELAAVRARLGDPGVRLVTLTGPGGVGKTRLALEAARDPDRGGRFADGVWFAGLAPLADAALVPQGIATALGVREEAGRPLLETVQEALRPRRLLLVLDNCEHLVDACARVAEALLGACPRLTILATSREALNVAGETVWPVPPLPVPPRAAARSPAALLEYDAVRLFVARAGATVPAFALSEQTAAAAAEICVRLDGLPLALELAAARVRLLGPEQLAARLGDRFRLLTGGARTALPRHQTLRATVDWSYGLLPAAERTLFGRLGVFAGDWSLEAAEAVGGGDGGDGGDGDAPEQVVELLGRLVDKSLVVVQPPAPGPGGAGGPGGAVRYRLLETLRQYARERLTAADARAAAARRHARYYLGLVERAEARLWAGDEAGALGRIAPEHDNVRAALRHLLDSGEAELAARLAGALGMFWFFRGQFGEGRTWLREVLGQGGAVGPPGLASAAAAKALHADGRLAHGQGDYAAAEQRLHAALAVWRRLGDGVQTSNALFLLGRTEMLRGRGAAARARFLEGLACAEAAGDLWVASLTRLWLAQLAFDEGDDAAARAGADQVLAGGAALGSRRNACFALRLLGDVAARRGDAARARPLLEASLAQGRAVGRWLAAWPAVHLAELLTEQHDHAGARALLGEALRTYRDAGDRQGVARSLEGCARLAAAVGAAAQALRLAGAAAALRTAAGAPAPPSERRTLDRHLAAARAALGARAAGAAWAAGQALPPAPATAAALALLETPEPGQGGPPAPAPAGAGPLTPREREVAALVARGLSNRAIGRELVITEATAERHLGNVYAKLGLASRAQLAVWAFEHGLGPHGPQRPG